MATADVAASFQKAVVDVLVEHSMLALESGGEKRFALAGGVSANRELRRMAAEMCGELKITLFMPELKLCTDNGAMIGSAAYYRLMRGELAGLALNAEPALRLVISG